MKGTREPCGIRDEQYPGWGAALVNKGCGGSRGDESEQKVLGDPDRMGKQGELEGRR